MQPPPSPPTRFLIERRKIVGYLLDVDHPDGGAKALFYLSHGFSPDNIEEFARRMLDHPFISGNVLAKVVPDIFATKFVYEGRLMCPNRTEPFVRSIWEWKSGESHGRLVTAYPCKETRSFR